MGLALVVPAAGASTRLGTCKARVQIGEHTALEHLLKAGSILGGTALVVTGAHRDEIEAGLPPGRAESLFHEGWEQGRTGGIRRAVEAREGRDLCMAPVDCPLVPATVFGALAREWDERGAPPRGWLAPRHSGRHGHPVVIGRDLARELLAFPPDRPLRELRDLADPLWDLAVAAREVLFDLDTPADLEAMRAFLRGGRTS